MEDNCHSSYKASTMLIWSPSVSMGSTLISGNRVITIRAGTLDAVLQIRGG